MQGQSECWPIKGHLLLSCGDNKIVFRQVVQQGQSQEHVNPHWIRDKGTRRNYIIIIENKKKLSYQIFFCLVGMKRWSVTVNLTLLIILFPKNKAILRMLLHLSLENKTWTIISYLYHTLLWVNLKLIFIGISISNSANK